MKYLPKFFAFFSVLTLLSACSTASLDDKGAKVAVVRYPLKDGCEPLGYIVGKGGGTFGGKWISNDQLIEYAVNDLRNKAGGMGATHVQTDPPQLGNGEGTTTTVTVTGTAYRCKGEPKETTGWIQIPSTKNLLSYPSEKPTQNSYPPPTSPSLLTYLNTCLS
jgi:hypothetical protein